MLSRLALQRPLKPLASPIRPTTRLGAVTWALLNPLPLQWKIHQATPTAGRAPICTMQPTSHTRISLTALKPQLPLSLNLLPSRTTTIPIKALPFTSKLSTTRWLLFLHLPFLPALLPLLLLLLLRLQTRRGITRTLTWALPGTLVINKSLPEKNHGSVTGTVPSLRASFTPTTTPAVPAAAVLLHLLLLILLLPLLMPNLATPPQHLLRFPVLQLHRPLP